ncbi:hypothetical protein BDV96DRAFT_187565 [Lophiotrema nucula]|uniref:NDT80 domain-containing protein n=1 Tax=Lophiotrema nucula TaxID=690887 RepID=A0A6A5YYF7_9PLEO|nr:hypothetical protein BDV96DRAFT_187565 [Lophiotrema nucula]
MSTRRMSSITDSQSMLPPARSPMGNPVSPLSTRDNYASTTPGTLRHPHTTLSPRHSDLYRYGSSSDTPRSVLPTTMPLQTSGYTVPAMYPQNAQVDRPTETPPFSGQENYYKITCEGTVVVPTIEAKIDKGFFMSSDHVWTCYRRNYFAVSVFYSLAPWTNGGRLYIDHGGNKGAEQIQSIAISLAAAVDGTAGKSIELIQHTPKRDKGPQLPMKKEYLSPTPPGKAHDHGYSLNSFTHQSTQTGPSLPMQHENESTSSYSPTSHSNSNYQHSFERIQFKSATANNGKRRAQQQYYHLIVELWANVSRDKEPRWIKIAAVSSHPVVVRGRSPSHYSNEGPHNPGSARGNGGSGGPSNPHSGLGPNARSGYPGGYGNGISGSGGSAMGGSMYRGNTYSLDPSPVNSHSVSSASSISGGPVEGLVGDRQMVEDDDTKMIDSHDGYQYYPAPLYDSISTKVEGHGLPLPDRRVIKEEFPGPATLASGWQVGGCGGRFQGMETSRGYYPAY